MKIGIIKIKFWELKQDKQKRVGQKTFFSHTKKRFFFHSKRRIGSEDIFSSENTKP